MRDFKYAQLPGESSFRILELLPGVKEDEVAYRLHLEDWKDPPSYEALSYAWGDRDVKVATICHDAILQVTPNLRSCLQHLRYQDRSRWLWADAVCINQQDLGEQGQQVSHIHQIYEAAKQVVVWLGDDEDGQAIEATRLITNIAKASCAREQFAIQDLQHRDHICNMTLHVSLTDLESPDQLSWDALAWFFTRPWFSRLWVFQEVNCGRYVVVKCGAAEIQWDFVALAANFIRARPSYAQNEAFSQGYYENACIMRRRYLHDHSSILHMLNSTKNFVTSDPLDRIYALLATPPFRKMSPSLVADYRKTKRRLYEDIAVRCIKDDHDLGVLGYSQDGAEETSSPSWIPDWEKRNWHYMIDHPHGENLSASGTTCFQGTVGLDSVLRAKGILFDTITAAEPIDIWEWFDRYGVALPRHIDVQSISQDQEISMNLRRVKTVELLQGGEHQSRSTFDANQVLLAGLSHYIARLLQLSKRDQAEIEVRCEYKCSSKTVSYQLEPRSKAWNRTFLSTKSGHLGFGPNTVKPGDLVCVLYGGKVPFVLRKVGEEHRLVGPAYVEGIMEGEVVESRGAQVLQEQTFSIH